MKIKNKPIKKNIFISLIIFSFIIFQGCLSDTYNDINITKKDILTCAFFIPESIFPYDITVENQNTIKPNIYNSLVEFDEVFQIVPGLAESWNNPNNLTWRFNLRKDVKFHNGNNFTSEDVKFTLEKIFVSYSAFIKEVNIIDNYSIDIITYEPYPGLLQRIALSFVVFSKKYMENIIDSENYWPIGTGAYKLVEYQENNYVKLERFDDYWRKKPEIKTVIFKIIIDADERVAELINGTIDIIDYNVDKKINDILKEENVKIVKYPPLSTYIIGFDLRVNNSYGFADNNNPTSDVRVRKAIYHAIDIEPLIEGPFMGFAQPASQFLTPYIFGYNSEIKRLEYNITEAKELLNESGYGDGFNITLDCITEGFDYNIENCQLISDQLSKIGINMSVNGMAMDEFNKKVVFEKNTSLWLVGWGTISVDGGYVYNNFIKSYNNSDGYYNSGHYSNIIVDKLGEKASIEMDPSERVKYLKDGFKIAIVDDVIIVPLFSQELFSLTSNNVYLPPRADLKILLEDIYFH